MLSSLTWSGASAWNSGLKPLNRTVRSSEGLVLLTGRVSSSASGSAPSAPLPSSSAR